MKYLLLFTLCFSFTVNPAFANPLDLGRKHIPDIEIPIPEFEPTPDDYPCDVDPTGCNETPCQQICSANYHDCMDGVDSIYALCNLIPPGPARDACIDAAQLLYQACSDIRDRCNEDCLPEEEQGPVPLPVPDKETNF